MSNGLDEQDVTRIVDAVDTIENCLARLAEAREEYDREGYRADKDAQAIVERRFVTMTEAALDIGRVLIVSEQDIPPESNPATMHGLSEAGILSDDLSEKMVEAARFRNVLAHTYGQSIDDDLVYDALGDLKRYRDFVVAVRDALDARGALDTQ